MMSNLICKSAIFLIFIFKVLSVPLPECSNRPIYIHTEMFEDNYNCNVTPKDVGAFKYFCLHNYISSIVNQYQHVFVRAQPFYLNNFTTICEEYVNIKTYQYLLYHRFFSGASDANVTNATITSVVYLLQRAGESLQDIQYDNNNVYCPDFDEEIRMLAECQNYTIESVFMTLYTRYEDDWKKDVEFYPELFNSSVNIQYKNGAKPRCQAYMSLYENQLKAIQATST